MVDAQTWGLYRNYQQTDEDRAEIAVYFDECRRVAAGESITRESAEELTSEARGRLEPTFARAFKTCSCCGEDITREEWSALRFVGVQDLSAVGLPDLEYRDHACGSTLATVLQ